LNLGFLFSLLNSEGRIFLSSRKVASGEERSSSVSDPKKTENVPPPSLGSWTSDSVKPKGILEGAREETKVGTSFSEV
jgi:hypothetical protein